jgi:hypothetical protein
VLDRLGTGKQSGVDRLVVFALLDDFLAFLDEAENRRALLAARPLVSSR